MSLFNFNDFPDEIILEIFYQYIIQVQKKQKLSLCCHKWNNLLNKELPIFISSKMITNLKWLKENNINDYHNLYKQELMLENSDILRGLIAASMMILFSFIKKH